MHDQTDRNNRSAGVEVHEYIVFTPMVCSGYKAYEEYSEDDHKRF